MSIEAPEAMYQGISVDSDPNASGPHAYLNADARSAVTVNGKLSDTIDEAASQLVRGAAGWSSALGVGFTVTYAYRADAPAMMPSDTAGFSRFNAAQISQADLAFKAWSDVANITFVRVGDGVSGEGAYSNNATILLGDYSSGVEGASAFANFPGSTRVTSEDGDLWVNSALSYNTAPTVGNYGGMVLVHEIGHTIGLDHPSDYDAEADTVINYAADASYYEDSRQYTVMSYFSEAETGGAYAGRYAASPQLDDIAAAQLEYGANMSTRLGDTVYGFNATADRPWFIAASSSTRLIFAVWDTGGKDTFDFSGYASNQLIDLRPGDFSNVGGLVGNVAIAQGVTIENAIGGSGSDVIHGNAFGNTINGGAGADTIDGGTGGPNYLRGDDGADSIAGSAGFDDINGNMGNDTAAGGAGDDWVVGGKDNDMLSGGAGGDLVYGNLGDDTVDGGDGADIVRGGQGSDVVVGGGGDDFLSGDLGADTVTGGAGADIFHSSIGAGLDRITDFNRAEGDYVLLDHGTTWSAAQAGSDTVITLGAAGSSDQVVLASVALASLTGAWILVA